MLKFLILHKNDLSMSGIKNLILTGWEEKNGHPNILQYDWGFISFLTHYRIPQIIVFDHFLRRILLQVDFTKKLTIL